MLLAHFRMFQKYFQIQISTAGIENLKFRQVEEKTKEAQVFTVFEIKLKLLQRLQRRSCPAEQYKFKSSTTFCNKNLPSCGLVAPSHMCILKFSKRVQGMTIRFYEIEFYFKIVNLRCR